MKPEATRVCGFALAAVTVSDTTVKTASLPSEKAAKAVSSTESTSAEGWRLQSSPTSAVVLAQRRTLS